ncbi:signal transduction histidine kinase [Marinobacterium halophilum]|uniref:histidine kinase n=1 Tax=Marinobacterium halophilum TaxID=267374 RepID=A0A2P8F2A0_9GAMM|nr:sensor histidine kinase [Marinobacterium halophilum]PSL15837.1 signal transduction histidine kinase [Marinobacterium halophilum]
MRLGIYTWLLVCLGLFTLSPAFAAPVTLGNQVIALDNGQLSLLEDPQGELGLEEAMQRFRAGEFKPIPHGVGEGYTHSAFWVHAELERPPEISADWAFSISPSYLDQVDIYVVQAGRPVQQLATGDQVEHSGDAAHNRLHVVRSELPEGRIDVFMRLSTTSTSALLVRLVPGERLVTHLDTRVFSEGVLIGIVLTVLIINFINGIWLKRSLFLYFVAYEFALMVTILLSTSTLRTLYPALSAADQNIWMRYGVLVSGMLAFIFFYRMLSFPFRGRRWIDILFVIGVSHSLTGILLTYWDEYIDGMYHINNFVIVYPLVVSLILLFYWRDFNAEQRFRASGFFAFGIFCSINSLYVSGYLGVTAITSYIAPVMILSFQLCLHFIIMFSVRKSEKSLLEAHRNTEMSVRKMELERTQRQAHETFMAMFSHEVRTPLAVIDASSQSLVLLEQDPGAREQRERRYQRIRAAVARIDQLLQMSLVRGRHEIDAAEGTLLHEYDIAALIKSVVVEFPELSQQRLEFEGVDETLLFRTRLPAPLLSVIVRNLIDNALKYSPAERPVAVIVKPEKQHLVFSVRDQGHGISEYALEHIYERHFRASEQESVPGLGLGLFVVKEMLDRYQGEINLETGREGTVFSCRLSREVI